MKNFSINIRYVDTIYILFIRNIVKTRIKKLIYLLGAFSFVAASMSILNGQSGFPELSYSKALALAFKQSPVLRAAGAELEKARGQKITDGQLLIANPEIEMSGALGVRKITPSLGFSPLSALQGNFPFDLSSNKVFGNTTQPIKGFELSISQQFDMSGKKHLQRKIAGGEMERAIIAYERAKLNLRSSVRINLMTYAAMEKLSADIQGRLNHLRAIWKKKGSNFIDSKLGPYAGHAFINDLLEMESDRQQVELAYKTSKNNLRGLLMIPDGEDFRVWNPESIPLPQIPDDQALVRTALQSSIDLKDAQAALKIAQDGDTLSRRLVFPDPSLFVGYGRQVLSAAGRYGPEREDEQVGRFGIRFQLPIISTKGERIKAKAEVEKAQATVNGLKNTITSSVLTAALQYRQLILSLEQLRYGVRRSSEALDQIDQAFMNGRISYFDFWNEYDRSNRFIRHYNDTLVSAATACGQLEMLIGRSLDKE